MRVLTILFALMLLSGIASGNLVSRYWLPTLVRGDGPTQSTITLLNDSSTAGIGFSGATGIH